MRGGAQQSARDGHEQRCGNSFAADIAHDEPQTIGIQQKEVEQIAAHFLGRGHGGMQLEVVAIREGRKLAGKHGALDHGGMLQLAGADPLRLLHFGQAGILDAHRGHVGHDREQAQILLGEFFDEM